MSKLVDVAAAADLAEGTMKAVTVGNNEFLLARVGGEFYAADEHCPHMGGRLSRGRLEGTIVVCPRHGSRFNLRNGRVDRWTEFSGVVLSVAKVVRSPRPLPTYPVHVQDGRLFVETGPDD